MSNKNSYILKQLQFKTESELDMELLNSIDSLGLNFNEETKLLWYAKIHNLNADDVRNERRLKVLKERLITNKSLTKSHVSKIQNEIKQIEESMNEDN